MVQLNIVDKYMRELMMKIYILIPKCRTAFHFIFIIRSLRDFFLSFVKLLYRLKSMSSAYQVTIEWLDSIRFRFNKLENFSFIFCCKSFPIPLGLSVCDRTIFVITAYQVCQEPNIQLVQHRKMH